METAHQTLRQNPDQDSLYGGAGKDKLFGGVDHDGRTDALVTIGNGEFDQVTTTSYRGQGRDSGSIYYRTEMSDWGTSATKQTLNSSVLTTESLAGRDAHAVRVASGQKIEQNISTGLAETEQFILGVDVGGHFAWGSTVGYTIELLIGGEVVQTSAREGGFAAGQMETAYISLGGDQLDDNQLGQAITLRISAPSGHNLIVDNVRQVFDHDRLAGGAGDDSLYGGDGADRLYGGDGNDTLDAGSVSGATWQYVYGAAGNDTYRYSKEDNNVYVAAAAETATSGTADAVVFTDLNASDVVWSGYQDYTATSSTEGKALRIAWQNGTGAIREIQIAQQGQHIESYIFADGSVFQSFVTTNDLNQTLTGTAQNNFMHGNSGADTLLGQAGADRLMGGAGSDLLEGGDGADTLDGGDGADRLYGGDGNDTLDAGSVSGATWQYIFGAAGNDTYRYSQSSGNVFVGSESASTGTADQFVFTDLSLGQISFDTIDYGTSYGGNIGMAVRLRWNESGTAREAQLALEGQHIETYAFTGGTTVNRFIVAGASDTTLSGTSGNDVIVGNDLANTFTGGAGDDVFVFEAGFGADTIADFNASNAEKIDLTEISGITDFVDLTTNHLSDNSGTARITLDSGNTIDLTGITVGQIGTALDYSADDFLF